MILYMLSGGVLQLVNCDLTSGLFNTTKPQMPKGRPKMQQHPQGNTQFQFTAAGFYFVSTSYDWLVIAGNKAQYKGTGTIANTDGTFGFLLTATDGDMKGGNATGPDKFRIKIWNTTTGDVVYDNVLGASDDIDGANPQVIGGGSIQIQSPNSK